MALALAFETPQQMDNMLLITMTFFIKKKNNNNYLGTKHPCMFALLGTKQTPPCWRQLPKCCACHHATVGHSKPIIVTHFHTHTSTRNSLSRCPLGFRTVRRPQRRYMVNKPIFKQRTTNLFRNWGKDTTALEMRQTKHTNTQTHTR